jgi:myo-inositol-1(or 4)-monophosphatase
MSGENASQATRRDARALLDTAIAAADAAAIFIRKRSGDPGALAWIEKSPADFVSEVDRGAEQRIREIVLGRHPSARIVGEELSPDAVADVGLAFIVDPLDGTTNFLHGYPEYAVSIGIARDGELVAAVVVNVPFGERFTALRGEGAWRDGALIRVSHIADPGRALIGTGFPFKHPDTLPVWQAQFGRIMLVTAGVRRAGAAALDLCDVACGRFEAFWELRLAPWDFAAGLLIIEEAGGIVTDLEGRPVALTHGPIVAGSPAMHSWLLSTLADPVGAEPRQSRGPSRRPT